MSHDDLKRVVIRDTTLIFEIDLDINDPTLSATLSLEPGSYETPKTTEDANAYTGTDFRTYRYAMTNVPGLNHFPNLETVTTNPPRVEPGKSIGFRATAVVKLLDFESNDVYELQGDYADRRIKGSHFLKLFARNYLHGRKARVVRWLRAGIFDTNDCIIEHYIIDGYTCPDERGNVTFRLVDELILAEETKAKMPLLSKGTLTADCTAIAATLSYTSPDGLEYGAVSVTGYVRINDEVLGYTVNSSSQLAITRGEWGTEAAEHSSGDLIQWCYHTDGENVLDTFDEALRNYTTVDNSFIDTVTITALKADELSLFTSDTLITEPRSVKSILNEIVRLTGLTVYVDVVNEKIAMIANPDFASPVVDFVYEKNIRQGTFKQEVDRKSLITRQSIEWFKPDISDDKYARKFIVIDAVKEAGADEALVSEGKVFKTDLLRDSATDSQLATSFAQREVNRFSELPVDVDFETDIRNIGQQGADEFMLGSIFTISHPRIVSASLARLVNTYQCISINETRDGFWRVRGKSFKAAAPLNADLYITENQTDYLLTDDLTTTEAREYVVVIASNVDILSSGSGSTNPFKAAFAVGNHFAGSTIKIINLGRIIGYGGAGGSGGDITWGDPTGTASLPSTAATAGGDGLALGNVDVTIDNTFGLIAGGGGGGGGALGHSDVSTAVPFVRAGGGGGGGRGSGSANGGAQGLMLNPPGPLGSPSNGAFGDAGNLSGPGARYDLVQDSQNPNLYTSQPVAYGGDFGEAGNDAGVFTVQLGGAAGKAIELNGQTATITGGNNTEQIKGVVS